MYWVKHNLAIKRLLSVLWLGLISPSWAQTERIEFPFPVIAGETFTVPADYDTVWLLPSPQYKTFLHTTRQFRTDSTMAALSSARYDLMVQLLAEKDSLIACHRQAHLHYQELWSANQRKFEQSELKNRQKWQFAIWGFYLGTGLTAAIAVVVGLVD